MSYLLLIIFLIHCNIIKSKEEKDSNALMLLNLCTILNYKIENNDSKRIQNQFYCNYEYNKMMSE